MLAKPRRARVRKEAVFVIVIVIVIAIVRMNRGYLIFFEVEQRRYI